MYWLKQLKDKTLKKYSNSDWITTAIVEYAKREIRLQ